MIPASLRSRLALAASAGLLATGFGAAGQAAAGPQGVEAPASQPVGPVVDDGYWACLALDHVELGTCLENPLPDLSGLPSIPQIVADVLYELGL